MKKRMSPLTPLFLIAILILAFLYYNEKTENGLLKQKKKNCDEKVIKTQSNLKGAQNLILRLDDKLMIASDSIRRFKVTLSTGSGQSGQDITSLLRAGDLSSGKSVRSVLEGLEIKSHFENSILSIVYA